ncbi:MAG: hypothetical protein QW512_05250 [Thermofilaceae archaeon]
MAERRTVLTMVDDVDKERVVREFLRGFRRAENVRAKDLSAYAELEGEVVVE